MTPWEIMRREAAGVLRSVRYDMDRRAETRLAEAPTARLHHAGPPRPAGPPPQPAMRPQPGLTPRPTVTRPAVTTVGVGLLLAGGVAGTYFAVAGGLGMLAADTGTVVAAPALAPPAVALASGHPAPVQPRATPRSTRSPRPAVRRAVVPPTPPAPELQAPPSASPSSSTRIPLPESTPTLPATPSVTPSASPSPSPSPSPTLTNPNDQGQPVAGN